MFKSIGTVAFSAGLVRLGHGLCRTLFHVKLYRRERRTRPRLHISGVKPHTVDIVSGKDRQRIIAVLEGAAAEKREKGSGDEETVPNYMHNGQYIVLLLEIIVSLSNN